MELLTKLGAVNAMLSSIGERPVNDLDDTGRLDVVRAKQTLEEVNRLVQSRGWWFNTVEELEIIPAGSPAQAILADNTLKILQIRGTMGLGRRRYILRRDSADDKLKLYNIRERTFTISDSPLTVDLVEGLEFEDIPETARSYIAHRAGVTFQQRTVGSRILHAFTEGEAAEYWRELQREEAENQAVEGGLNEAPLMRDLALMR